MLAAIHIHSPYDPILAPCRLGAGSVEVPSRFPLLDDHPRATLSRKLHTRRLLPAHVPVGYRQQNAGLNVDKIIIFND